MKDGSKYGDIALYKDDTIENVRIVQIAGEINNEDLTKVEIFYFKK